MQPNVNAIAEILRRLDEAFTRFNSRRSLLAAEAALEARCHDDLVCFRDQARATTRYYNRIVAPAEQHLPALDELIAWYDAAGIPCTVTTLPHRATTKVFGALGARGFQVTTTDCWFWCGLDSRPTPPPIDPGICIRRAVDEDRDLVFSIFLSDEPDPPVPEPVKHARWPAHLRAAFPIYIAELDGEPVAMATSFVHDGVALLGNANTLPHARGRGCQRALIEHRLADAARLGCHSATTDTSFGTVSHRNVVRGGMPLVLQSLTWHRPIAT